jgi:ribonuclease PH
MNDQTSYTRIDNRPNDSMRSIEYQTNIAPYALGSVLFSFGNTRVICSCTIENKIPGWMRAQNVEGGWITAEYSMLPYSTLDRKQRDITRGKSDGRTIEIQRLIGRSMRAVLDLKKLGPKTLWIDCDVLQADGGTRTASITGAFIAAQIAVRKLLKSNELSENPFTDSVAAVSAGIHKGTPILDLNYEEDKDASVDANIVMTGTQKFVEVQSSGEEATYSQNELNALIELGKKGIETLTSVQKQAIEAGLA